MGTSVGIIVGSKAGVVVGDSDGIIVGCVGSTDGEKLGPLGWNVGVSDGK